MTELDFERQSVKDWRCLYGIEIDSLVARQAADFADVIAGYGLEPEDLTDFAEENLEVGQRLFLAMSLPIEDMGMFLLSEKERVVIDVVKARLAENRNGGIVTLK